MLSERILHLIHAKSTVAHSGRALFPYIWFRQLPLCICFLLVTLLFNTDAVADTLRLTSSTSESTAGNYQLIWSWPDAPVNVSYQLSERVVDPPSESTYVVIYEGGHTASVLSGKPNGAYEYRVTALSNELTQSIYSNSLTVKVAHHSLTDALVFFSIGVVIFLAILVVIFRGARQTN